MRNKIIMLACLFVIVISIVCSYRLLSNYHEEHKFDENIIESRKSLEPCSILNAAIERKKWDELALTDNFKNKYKTRDDIIPNRKKYTVFSCGYNFVDGRRCISISADKPGSIFDLYGANSITDYFYFDYKLDEKGYLDDITLVKTEKVYTLTGNLVENE